MKAEVIQRTIDNLKRNGFGVRFHKTRAEAVAAILTEIDPASSVGFGGSITLDELDLFDRLKERGNPVYWNWKLAPGDDRSSVTKKTATTDVYLTGTNTVTEDGTFVNIDGTGNRLSSMLYGHNKVLMVAGTNKIVRNLEEAMIRIKNVASPQNAQRLNRDTPCATLGKCMNCDSDDRICSATLILDRQPGGSPITLHLIDDTLGY